MFPACPGRDAALTGAGAEATSVGARTAPCEVGRTRHRTGLVRPGAVRVHR